MHARLPAPSGPGTGAAPAQRAGNKGDGCSKAAESERAICFHPGLGSGVEIKPAAPSSLSLSWIREPRSCFQCLRAASQLPRAPPAPPLGAACNSRARERRRESVLGIVGRQRAQDHTKRGQGAPGVHAPTWGSRFPSTCQQENRGARPRSPGEDRGSQGASPDAAYMGTPFSRLWQELGLFGVTPALHLQHLL